MSEEIELSKRGRKQLQSVVYNEIKKMVDESIAKQLEIIIERRVVAKLEDIGYKINDIIKKQVSEIYWKVMEEALTSAGFQDMFKNEIIKYLHEKWACGSVPFETKFTEALTSAIIEIIKEVR